MTTETKEGMVSTKVVVDHVEKKETKRGEATMLFARGMDKPLFVGPKRLQDEVRALSEGEEVQVNYRNGNFGPILVGLGDDVGNTYKGSKPAKHIDKTVLGFPIGFLGRWSSDIYNSLTGKSKTPENAVNTLKEILTELNNSVDEK